MLRRPFLVLAALSLLVLGVLPPLTGASPTAAAEPAAAAAAVEACPIVGISRPDRAPVAAEPGGGPARGGCWTVTPDRDGVHLVALSYDEASLRTRVRVLDPDGRAVLDQAWQNGHPAPAPRLRAGVAYRVEVDRDRDRAVTPELRVAVFDLHDGCRPLPEPRWSVALERFDLSEGRVACGELTTTTDSPLRVQLDAEQPGETLAVLDDEGGQVCVDDLRRRGPVVRCESLPAGRYRVVSGVRGGASAGERVGLAAVPVDTLRDCVEMAPGRYGAPLPVGAQRAADGQECFAMTAPTTGPFDLRTWQPADRLDWAVEHELWDATAGRLVTAYGGDAHVNPGPQPERVDLVAGHSYRLLVSGRRPAEPAGGGQDDDGPRYRVGLIDRTSDAGCTPLETGWDASPATDRVEAGEIACRLVEAPAGQWARIDYRAVGEVPWHEIGLRVLDADGRQVSNHEVGVTCRGRGDSGGGTEAWSCPLSGPGPYRVLTHASWGTDVADTSLAVSLPSDGSACAPLPLATWGKPLPGEGVRAAGGAGADCWTTETVTDGRHLLTTAAVGQRWPRARMEILDAADGRPVGGDGFPFSNAGTTAELTPGRYRVVVSGDPGAAPAPYRLGLHDVTGTSSDGGSTATACPWLGSTSLATEPESGRTASGSRDCYRLPDVDGPVLARLDSTAQARDAGALMYDRRGWNVCGARAGEEGRCELEGTGPYRVVVGDTAGPSGSSYRLSVRRPGERDGCLAPGVAAPGAAPVDLPLTASGGSACVALPRDATQLLWALDAPDGVEATLLDGDARSVCNPVAPEPDSRVCLTDGHPAPYTLSVTNTTDADATARALLRLDPGAEPGCADVALTPDGPPPMTGTTTGDLDLACHALPLNRNTGYALNRFHDAAGVPPDAHVFGPDGAYGCGGTGARPPRDFPICHASSSGRHVVVVVGSDATAGPYRVETSCSHDGCARLRPTSLRPGSMDGPVRVGRPLSAAGVRNLPPRGRVAWRWRVDGTLVRRTRDYTPVRVDRGRRLQLVAVVTAPDTPRRVLRTVPRTVQPARRG